MTPEQIEQLARQIVDQGLPIDWKVYLVMGLLALVGAAIGAVVAGFYSKQGEIKAIHDQLDKVEEQTRRITNAVEREKSLAWVEQKRWDLRRGIYTDLIQRLDRLLGIHARIIHVLRSNNHTPPELKAEYAKAMENILPIFSVARVFVSHETLVAFRELYDGTKQARILTEQIGQSPAEVPYSERVPVVEALQSSAAKLIDLLVEAAKRDLILS